MKPSKNIHVIPTDKPSRLSDCHNDKLHLDDVRYLRNYQNIYITSDEEIKEGDWVYSEARKTLFKVKSICNTSAGYLLIEDDVIMPLEINEVDCKKIILTTYGDLIKDGVQAIDDEFLEWFVKNPSCEEVEVFHQDVYSMSKWDRRYKIIIPKEEPKTAWVGVLHDKLNEYHPAEYELKDIYQGEGCLPHFPDEELCQIWCESKYKEVPQQDKIMERFIKNAKQQETIEDKFKSLVSKWQQQQVHYEILAEHYIDDQHNNRKFTYKAMATRDCWKELLTLINSIADEK